jgi:dTMP kinase
MSLFITFEGGEGSGKSTQAKLLHRRLVKLAVPVILVHEPGVTELGKKMSRILKWAQNVEISPMAELMLFNVSRAQLVNEVVRPELENGKVVICDRFADSSTAYQGYGRGLDIETVKAVNNAATGGLNPGLTILLDMPVEQGFKRKAEEKPDRFESESMNFHRRVREGYLDMAGKEPERWLVMSAADNKEIIANKIWQKVSGLISGRG